MIECESIVLRAPLDSDVDFFAGLRNDLDLQFLLMARARGSTREQVADWLRGCANRTDYQFLVVADKGSDVPMGFVQLANVDPVSQCGELGICLAADYQGGSCAGEALQGFENYLLNTLNISKVVLSVLASNQRAIDFYLRKGYSTVGTHRAHCYFNGAYHDVVVMEKCTAPR